MGYYEFNIKVNHNSSDALAERLAKIGCLGIIINDDSLTVYFPDAIYLDKVKEELRVFKEILKDAGLSEYLSYNYVYISERDWSESWKKKFQPIDLGDSLTIIPPWLELKKERVNIIIDPGMAFGTGHHETTMRCLMLIENLSKKLENKKDFLDLGTGTGILAIAASKLGFENVFAVDIDPLAIEASKRNVALNNLKNIKISCDSIRSLRQHYDFIVANLLASTLIKMADEIVSHLKKQGIIVLSGIMVGQEDDIIKTYSSYKIYFTDKIIDGRWVTILGSKV
ncbi:MAG: 50S ribosomal protein L11 methyltransferase [Thermodesulfovibrionales bacterium]|nr:50S ribosomal protein L11 methyltransferase [Thermodesulfovibrionales bacterium]